MKHSLKEIVFTTVLTVAVFSAVSITNSFADTAKSSSISSSKIFETGTKTKQFTKRGILMSQSQAFGSKCSTPAGSCTIQPQPVGSPCRCGQARGTTWR